MNIGLSIKELRKKRNLRQADLAKKIGVRREYLSLVEGNKKVPTFNLLKKISEALGISTPILIFYAMESQDIPENKKEYYKILHSGLKSAIESENEEGKII